MQKHGSLAFAKQIAIPIVRMLKEASRALSTTPDWILVQYTEHEVVIH
jgi:hypothetical protein